MLDAFPEVISVSGWNQTIDISGVVYKRTKSFSSIWLSNSPNKVTVYVITVSTSNLRNIAADTDHNHKP